MASVFAKITLRYPCCIGPLPSNQLNAKDADMEKEMLLHDVTTKVLGLVQTDPKKLSLCTSLREIIKHIPYLL